MWDPFLALTELPGNNSSLTQDPFSNPEEALSPEKRLLFAVIEQAIRDFLEHSSPEAKQAHRWLFEDRSEGELHPFTFDWICRQLDLDKEKVRLKVGDLLTNGVPKEAAGLFRRKFSVAAES